MDLTSSSSFSSTIGNTSSSSWGAGGGASAMVTSVSSAMDSGRSLCRARLRGGSWRD